MTSLKFKLKNYRSYRDFTFTMHWSSWKLISIQIFASKLIDWLIDWLIIDWLIDWLIDIDWLFPFLWKPKTIKKPQLLGTQKANASQKGRYYIFSWKKYFRYIASISTYGESTTVTSHRSDSRKYVDVRMLIGSSFALNNMATDWRYLPIANLQGLLGAKGSKELWSNGKCN